MSGEGKGGCLGLGIVGILGIGCGGAILLFIAMMVGIVFFGLSLIKDSIPYKTAVAEAEASQQVTSVIGSPVQGGMMIQGNINNQGSTGSVDLVVPISGSKGNGEVKIIGKMQNGVWTYTTIKATVGGQSVNLMSDGAGNY